MDTKKCHFCGEEILTVAKKCKHCGEWLENAIIVGEKKMVECPFCAEGIEDGLKICPLCEEPLVKDNQFGIVEKPKKKKSKMLTILGTIIAIVGLVLGICLKMGISFNDVVDTIDIVVDAVEDVVDAAEDVIDNVEQQENISTYDYNGVKIPQKAKTSLEGTFSDFLKNFTKDKETQIALINKPFRFGSLDWDDEVEWNIWNEQKIKKDWHFWESKYFIEGTWYESNDIIIYEYSQIFIFKKINNKWCLYEFIDSEF